MAALTRIQTLSIGSQTISAATFSTGKGGNLILENYSPQDLPPEMAAEVAHTAQMGFALEELSGQLNTKIPSRYTISGQSVFTRFVKLPPMEEGKVEEIVEFEAQQNVPFPIQEVIWDYQLFNPEASGETEVALVAIKADVLNQINEQIEDAGIPVSAVDVAPMALLNAFRYNYPDVKEPSLVIDIGARTTNLIFSEEGRCFTRTLPVGGSAVTAAIAKDFQVPFEDAEKKKVRDGFVSLGGTYAENPDPTLAAIGRAARTAMTRLHSEITRTINYYRSQLGGSQPRMAFLCGGGSAMPYTKEFFEEKLGFPIDYFNALRNVAVSEEAASQAAASAYRLGEHVGLALRSVSSCPMEINLEPDLVALRRETKERKPFWLAGAACLVAGMGALAAFAQFSASKSETQAADIQDQERGIKNLSRQIDGGFDQVDTVNQKRLPLLAAFNARNTWPQLLNELNKYFASDVLWVTDIDPLRNGSTFLNDMTEAGGRENRPVVVPGMMPEDEEPVEKVAPKITALRIRGLWRSTPSSPSAGQDTARTIFTTIQGDPSSVFDGEKMNSSGGLKITGQDETSLAWPFEMTLPLRTPLPLD